MSFDFISRIAGMIVFGLLGGYFGVDLANITTITIEEGAVIFGLVGALFGLVITPLITTRPIKSLRSLLNQLDSRTLGSGLIGLFIGLVIAALMSIPLSKLPSLLGEVFPFVGVLLFGYIGVAVFVSRRNDIFSLFSGRVFPLSEKGSSSEPERVILVDTSVIIDGRIADIATTGFLVGELLIPRFVLDELQHIADSADSLRRQRGRRGMEILADLQESKTIPVRISDIDVDLNINELANSVKAVLLPGEAVEVKIIQEGKERGQGVGYLSDGTMVVVEDGKNHMNEDIRSTVTKVLQTAAGRMIFAKPDEV